MTGTKTGQMELALPNGSFWVTETYSERTGSRFVLIPNSRRYLDRFESISFVETVCLVAARKLANRNSGGHRYNLFYRIKLAVQL